VFPREDRRVEFTFRFPLCVFAHTAGETFGHFAGSTVQKGEGMRVYRCSRLLGIASLFMAAGAPAWPAHKLPAPSVQFKKSIPKADRIPHALNRLTFGPRPGDTEHVQRIGLKKWIDLQLHPERIKESPELQAKLDQLDTLSMSSADLVRNYPTPQIVRLMANGQMPYPTDPDRVMMIRRLAERFARTQGNAAPPPAPQLALADFMPAAQIRVLRTGAPAERLALFENFSKEQQDGLIEIMPGPVKQALFDAAPPELRRRIEMSFGPQQVVARDLAESKLLHVVYGNRQLEEVLTDFWYNHFNVFLEKGADHYLVTQYERDAIRPHVLGKFRDLLEATAKSPAMLFYLDNWQSAGAGPAPARGQRRGLNENYGRELLELHTLGVDGGYTQQDVTETARCFTGWTIRQPERGGDFFFNPRMHDTGEKTVLGVKIPAGGGIEDGEKVLDILAHHPSTARFISRELAQRFVADDPPPELVARMAQVFLKTDGDLREVMKTMFDSKEFWSAGAYRSKMKSPLEFVASAVRASGAGVDYAFNLSEQVARLGQPPYRKQEPTGYSNLGREWMNSAGLLARMNFAVQLAANRIPGVIVKPDSVQATVLGAPDFQMR
jgi:uncharacterized protein (DUF1800 family)